MRKLAGFNRHQTAVRSMQEIEAGTEESLREAAKPAVGKQPIRLMKDIAANAKDTVAEVKTTAEAAAQRSTESSVGGDKAKSNAHFAEQPRNQPRTEVVDDAEKLKRNTAAALWVATLIFSVIPGLLVLLVKSEDSYLRQQAEEAVNWGCTLIAGWVICSILMLIFIGYPLMVLLGVAHVVFCFMGAQAALAGRKFRVPMSWRPLWG